MPLGGHCEEAGQTPPALVRATYTSDSGTGPSSALSSPASPLLAATQMPHPIADLKSSIAALLDTPSGIGLYSRYALAGAVCCSFIRAVLTPIDV